MTTRIVAVREHLPWPEWSPSSQAYASQLVDRAAADRDRAVAVRVSGAARGAGFCASQKASSPRAELPTNTSATWLSPSAASFVPSAQLTCRSASSVAPTTD